MLTETQIERYSRQIILPQVGGRGQEELLGASIAIVGARGPGSTAAAYLAAVGIGSLALFDSALVESADLLSGVSYSGATVGQNCAQSAARALAELNPDCRIEPSAQQLAPEIAAELTSRHDVIISTANDFAAASLLNAACVRLQKPFLWGRTTGFRGEVAVFSGHRSDAPCYRCLYPFPSQTSSAAEDAHDVFAPAGGWIGTVLAIEAIKIVLHLEDAQVGRLMTYDAYAGAVHDAPVRKDPHCPTCGVTAKLPGAAE